MCTGCTHALTFFLYESLCVCMSPPPHHHHNHHSSYVAAPCYCLGNYVCDLFCLFYGHNLFSKWKIVPVLSITALLLWHFIVSAAHPLEPPFHWSSYCTAFVYSYSHDFDWQPSVRTCGIVLFILYRRVGIVLSSVLQTAYNINFRKQTLVCGVCRFSQWLHADIYMRREGGMGGGGGLNILNGGGGGAQYTEHLFVN